MLCISLYHIGNGGNKLFVFVFVFVIAEGRGKGGEKKERKKLYLSSSQKMFYG